MDIQTKLYIQTAAYAIVRLESFGPRSRRSSMPAPCAGLWSESRERFASRTAPARRFAIGARYLDRLASSVDVTMGARTGPGRNRIDTPCDGAIKFGRRTSAQLRMHANSRA